MFTPFAFRTQFIQNETPVLVPGGNSVPEIDPDAQAFLTAAGITDPTITSAINNLVVSLKGASLWSKSNAIYPFVGGTATTHKFNLVNPADTNAAFRLDFLGGMTHNSNGITGNGTSNFATTYLQVNGDLAGGSGSSQNDNHMFYYGNIAARNNVDMGAAEGSSAFQMNARNGSNAFNTWNQSSTVDSASGQTLSSGIFGMTRNSSTSYTKFVNTTKAVATRTSTTPVSRDIFIMAQNAAGTAAAFQNRNMRLVSLGYGLSDTDIDNWVTINEAFQTELGRFI